MLHVLNVFMGRQNQHLPISCWMLSLLLHMHQSIVNPDLRNSSVQKLAPGYLSPDTPKMVYNGELPHAKIFRKPFGNMSVIYIMHQCTTAPCTFCMSKIQVWSTMNFEWCSCSREVLWIFLRVVVCHSGSILNEESPILQRCFQSLKNMDVHVYHLLRIKFTPPSSFWLYSSQTWKHLFRLQFGSTLVQVLHKNCSSNNAPVIPNTNLHCKLKHNTSLHLCYSNASAS